jgi:hypothetical protein
MSTFDPAERAARELLSYFGKNTAILVTHSYGSTVLFVKSARTGNVIAEIDLSKSNMTMHHFALEVMASKKFPRVRNMKRAWSPIVLTPQALKEQDIRRATILNYGY